MIKTYYRENATRDNVSHQIYRQIIYHKSIVSLSNMYYLNKKICMCESPISSLLDQKKISPPFGNIKKEEGGSLMNQGWGGGGGNTEHR